MGIVLIILFCRKDGMAERSGRCLLRPFRGPLEAMFIMNIMLDKLCVTMSCRVNLVRSTLA